MAAKITDININGFFISAHELERLMDAADSKHRVSKCFMYLGFGHDEYNVTILDSGSFFLKPTYVSLDRKNWERVKNIIGRKQTAEDIENAKMWLDDNEFAEWCMNPERKNESAGLMLAKHFVKDNGKESVAEMRKLLDFAENALREKIAKIAFKKGLMEIDLQEKLTDQGIDAENIEAICAIYDRMLADQMEKEVV